MKTANENFTDLGEPEKKLVKNFRLIVVPVTRCRKKQSDNKSKLNFLLQHV